MLDTLRARLGDRYEIQRQLGRGGMGAVYLARDRTLDRPVALKVLPPEFAAQPDLRERFLRETRTAAGFSHPNVVPVFAVEEREGLLAYAMGYVEGESLAERVKRAGPLPVRDLVRLLSDVAYALAYAHGRGVVHRDIKPDNIMIERATGRALVMDFGIARAITPAAATAPGLTRVGEVVGTPEFMSPEQASGDAVDGRSDLYSLGLVAWFAAVGRQPITGDTAHQVLTRQFTEVIPPLGTLRPDLPEALAAVVDRCVAKDPAERFPAAEALVEALDTSRIGGVEVPLPIRLLGQELGTVGLTSLFAAIIMLLMIQAGVAKDRSNVDVSLWVVFLLGIIWSRAAQTFAELRRVRRLGFSVADIRAGLEATLLEQEQERARRRADPAVVARRRRAVWVYAGILAFAVLSVWWAASQRVQVGPTKYRLPTPLVIMVIADAILAGVAFLGLLRSPLRPPVAERAFRAVWLGFPGRVLFSLAGRGLEGAEGRPGTSGVTGGVGRPSGYPAAITPPPPPAAHGTAPPPSGPTGDRLGELEERVAALERWRAGHGADDRGPAGAT